MSHIFFERLEKRQSTQSLFAAIGGNTAIAIYSVQVPDPGWGNIGYNPGTTPNLLYGVNLPSNPGSGSYFPWYGGGLFGGGGYNGWANPFNSYNSYGPWGLGNFFGGLFGGFFGRSFPGSRGYTRPTVPDFRLLYGVFPNPQLLYGVSIAPSPPTSIIAYYGVAVPEYGVGIPY